MAKTKEDLKAEIKELKEEVAKIPRVGDIIIMEWCGEYVVGSVERIDPERFYNKVLVIESTVPHMNVPGIVRSTISSIDWNKMNWEIWP